MVGECVCDSDSKSKSDIMFTSRVQQKYQKYGILRTGERRYARREYVWRIRRRLTHSSYHTLRTPVYSIHFPPESASSGFLRMYGVYEVICMVWKECLAGVRVSKRIGGNMIGRKERDAVKHEVRDICHPEQKKSDAQCS